MLQGFEHGVFLADIVAASQDEEAYALRIGFSVAAMDAFIQFAVFSKAHKAKRNQINWLVPLFGKRLATNETLLFQLSKMRFSESAGLASSKM